MTDGGVGPDSSMWSGFHYSNPAVDVAQLHKDYLAAHPEYTPPQPRYVGDQVPAGPWLAGLQIIPGSTGAWAPEGYAFGRGPGDMLNPDPYALPALADWPGGHIHGQPMPSTNGFFAKGTGLLKNAIAAKLALLQNPPPPAPPAPVQAAAPPVNLGAPGPLPGASNTPGVSTALTERAPAANLGMPSINTGLTAEQQRALMFQVA